MSLKDRLIARIEAQGPMTIAQYMATCLHDPKFGYYATRPALGEAGDFITAPLVSQMFGELIGLWAVETWRGMGGPRRLRLIEIGPGDGTLMSDMLRAAKVDPAFLAALDVWLVEPSAPLKRLQADRLGEDLRWAGRLADVPEGAPMLLIANEVLDCLPPRQFIRTAGGWAERVVGVRDGALVFGLTGAPDRIGPSNAPEGSVLEISDAQRAFGTEVGGRIAREGGVALLIDYGPGAPQYADTLQALHRHQKRSPLEAPGEDDLTVHANFVDVASAACNEDATACLTTQGAFLRRLGLDERAAALAAAAPDRTAVIERQRERLAGADQMGELFKALCLYGGGQTMPPGFAG